MIRDRDGIYGSEFVSRINGMNIEEVITAPQSPWREAVPFRVREAVPFRVQNPYVERLIGSMRRDCLNHVIVLNERHLVRILLRYQRYYNTSRTHLSLEKDTPEGRPVQSAEVGAKIIAFPEVGGLHHRYERRAA
jgi:hypothetical protein